MTISETLENHHKWLENPDTGKRANLRGAHLYNATLINTRLKLFQSDLWTAHIQPDQITIGCQKHPTEAWKAFTDKEISKMHPHALKWWNDHKAIVFAIQESL